MDIQKESEAYLKMLVGNDAISNDQAETLKLMSEGSHFYTYGNQVSVAKLDLINWGWNSWVKAKSQAVPEGFVLVPQASLKVALSWMDADIDPWQMSSDCFSELYEHKPILEKAMEAQEQSHE